MSGEISFLFYKKYTTFEREVHRDCNNRDFATMKT